MSRIFTGDYSTGDLSQWGYIDNKLATGGSVSPANYTGYGQYPLAVITEDKDCGYCARFEVRSGDIGLSANERCEVSSYSQSEAPVGSTRWYAFSVKFDETFPENNSDYGWGVTNQWHDHIGSPTIAWGFNGNDGKKTPAGYWSLIHTPQSGPGAYLVDKRILDIPLNLGNWIDIKTEIHWSTNDVDGYVRVWVNGERQTFLTGGQTFTERTATPGATSLYYKEGLYRKTGVGYPTGIIYHTAYRMADSEDSL